MKLVIDGDGIGEVTRNFVKQANKKEAGGGGREGLVDVAGDEPVTMFAHRQVGGGGRGGTGVLEELFLDFHFDRERRGEGWSDWLGPGRTSTRGRRETSY